MTQIKPSQTPQRGRPVSQCTPQPHRILTIVGISALDSVPLTEGNAWDTRSEI